MQHYPPPSDVLSCTQLWEDFDSAVSREAQHDDSSGGLLSAEDFAAIQREGFRTELISGECRAMPPAFGDHGRATMRLSALLGAYIIGHGLGEVYAAETGFLLNRNPDAVRAPDFAFIQASRVTPQAQAPMWNPVIPDLVVEVVSSGDRPKTAPKMSPTR